MCGVLGVLEKEMKAEELVEAAETMDERGPDDEGFADLDSGENMYGTKTPEALRDGLGEIRNDSTSKNWLAHKRLEVTGGEESHQPMKHGDLWMVFEGEIYNYREIREELEKEGHDFETCGDTEVLLKAYSEWKDAAFEKLRGKWIAAFYSSERGELTCYTDRFGTKPLYFTDRDGFAFSSTIRPLLELNREPRQNEDVVKEYLKYGLTDHRRETFFRDVKRLKAGEKLVHDGESTEIRRWHQGFEETQEDIRGAVERSFERHVPEKEYAATLSGGLDSTILASKVDSESDFHSASLPGSGEDEREIVEETAEELGIDVTFTEPEPLEIVRHSRESISHLEEPSPFLPFQVQSLLFEDIRSRTKSKVVLQGSGSDELFCGYRKFLPFHVLDTLKEEGVTEAMRELGKHRESLGRRELLETLSLALPGGEMLRQVLTPFEDSLLDFEHSSTPGRYSCGSLEEAVSKHLKDYWFPAIMRCADKNSASRGLEVRAAYLDTDLASAAFKDLKSNFEDGETKHRLREAFREDIPDRVSGRKEKQGFASTDDRWMTPEVREEMHEVFSSESFQNRRLLKTRKILRKLEKRELGFEKAYRFYQYELWMREFIDGREGR